MSAGVGVEQAVISKFPDAVLEKWESVFFMPLVARLVSDPSPKCKSLVGDTLKVLLQVSHAPFNLININLMPLIISLLWFVPLSPLVLQSHGKYIKGLFTPCSRAWNGCLCTDCCD